MSDDDRSLRDILAASPLEEPGRKRRKDGRGGAGPGDGTANAGRWPIVAGIAAGGLLVLSGYALAGGQGEATPTTTVPPSTSTPSTTVAEPVTGFPEGYAQIDDTTAIKPEKISHHEGELLVTFTAATLRGLDPAETAGFQGADMELMVDPPVTSTPIVFDPVVSGVFTVVFPYSGSVDASTGIHVTSEWTRSVTFLQQLVDPAEFPTRRTDPTLIDLDDTNSLSVDEIDLDSDGGELRWSLVGDADGAVVAATVQITKSFNDANGIFMVDDSLTPGFSDFSPMVPAAVEHHESGVVGLSAPFSEPEQVYAVWISWNVAWVTTIPADVTVQLGDAPTT
jgi:hypothetical protein